MLYKAVCDNEQMDDVGLSLVRRAIAVGNFFQLLQAIARLQCC